MIQNSIQNDTTYLHPLGPCLERMKKLAESRLVRGKTKIKRSRPPKRICDKKDIEVRGSSVSITDDLQGDHRQSKRPKTDNLRTGQQKPLVDPEISNKNLKSNLVKSSIQYGTVKRMRAPSDDSAKLVKRVMLKSSDPPIIKHKVAHRNNQCSDSTKDRRSAPLTKSGNNLRIQSNETTRKGGKMKRSETKWTEQSKAGKPTSSEIWFDDVPPALIAASREDQSSTRRSLVKNSSYTGPTRRIAIDCEFVGVGFEGKENALARVSIVNQFGHVLLDRLVRPAERVTDYRTRFSGIRPEDLRPGGPARPFHEVHKEVAKLCQGRVLVGHSIGTDLKVLMLSHPRRLIRDTARYRPFRALFNGRTPSLRALTERVLGITVQAGEHSSIEDAQAAMRLYTSVKRVWESGKRGHDPKALGLPEEPKPSLSEDQTQQKQLDLLAEFESGLETENMVNSATKAAISKAIPWDQKRSRRCSKKRAKFLQKRARRSANRGFQSAKM